MYVGQTKSRHPVGASIARPKPYETERSKQRTVPTVGEGFQPSLAFMKLSVSGIGEMLSFVRLREG